MGRAVVYTFLATAFFLFIIFSPKNQNGHTRLGLNRRLGYKFYLPRFDPLVAKLQRLAEEKIRAEELASRSSHSGDGSYNSNVNSVVAEDVDDDKDREYFNDDGRLNVTLRLLVLFPLLDRAPKDGKVSFGELNAWNAELAMDRLHYRTKKEMELSDKDGDGAISFSEFLPQFSQQDMEKNDMDHGEAGWWMEQFRNADADHNGNLNVDEFNNFLHPEDSNNREIQKWLLREKIKRMDDDKDGKLNQAEFSNYAYGSYKSYAEFETATGAQVSTKEAKFNELDVNQDKFLDVRELIPMLGYLRPGELSHGKYYTGFLIREADDNGDGYLTIEEMLNHEHTFYDTVYADSQEDSEYDKFHDEL